MLIPSFNTAGSNAGVCVCVCLCACKRGKTHLAFIILLTSSSLSFSHRLSLRVLYPSVLPLPPPVPHLVAIRPTARTRLHISLKKQTRGKRRRRQQVVYKRRHKNKARSGIFIDLAGLFLPAATALPLGRKVSTHHPNAAQSEASEVCHAMTGRCVSTNTLSLMKTWCRFCCRR